MQNEMRFDPRSPLVPIIRRALDVSRSGAFVDEKIRSICRQLAESYPEGELDGEGVIQELATRLSRILTARHGGGEMTRHVHRETVRL